MTTPVEAVAGIGQPRCGAHPGNDATPCRRCGQFACSECFGTSALCPACRWRAAAMVAPTERLAERVKWWLGLDAGLGLIVTATSAAMTTDDEAILVLAPVAVYLIVFLGARIELLRWMYRVTKNCEQLGAGFNRSARWAVASFFIPFANLFVPYWHMNEVASWVRFRDPGSIGVGVWWTSWIVASILDNLGGRLGRSPDPDLHGVATVVSLFGSVAMIAAAATCIGVIRNIERAFAERLDGLTPPANLSTTATAAIER